jgi:hypothetical protein
MKKVKAVAAVILYLVAIFVKGEKHDRIVLFAVDKEIVCQQLAVRGIEASLFVKEKGKRKYGKYRLRLQIDIEIFAIL